MPSTKCEVCNIYYVKETDFNKHLLSDKHKKRQESLNHKTQNVVQPTNTVQLNHFSNTMNQPVPTQQKAPGSGCGCSRAV